MSIFVAFSVAAQSWPLRERSFATEPFSSTVSKRRYRIQQSFYNATSQQSFYSGFRLFQGVSVSPFISFSRNAFLKVTCDTTKNGPDASVSDISSPSPPPRATSSITVRTPEAGLLTPPSSEFLTIATGQAALACEVLNAPESAVYLGQKSLTSGCIEFLQVATYRASPLNSDDTTSSRSTSPKRKRRKLPNMLIAQAASLPNYPFVDANIPLGDGMRVFPLIYSNLLLGLLIVARRTRRGLSGRQRAQMTVITQTLAMACSMDKRVQWHQAVRAEHTSLISDLTSALASVLKQVRGPLTVMRTLGRMLMGRLRIGEPARDLATNILAQADRLQEIIVKLDEAVSMELFDETTETIQITLSPSPKYLPPPKNSSSPSTLPPQVPPSSKPSDTRSAMTTAPPSASPAAATATLQPSHPQPLPHPQPVVMEDVLRPVMIASSIEAEDCSVQLVIRVDFPLPKVMGDADMMREAFQYVLDSALHRTPEGGTISIDAGPTMDVYSDSGLGSAPAYPHYGVRVAISDTGAGLSQGDLVRLMRPSPSDPFPKPPHQAKVKRGNLDGLLLAKQLIERLGGQLYALSPCPEEYYPSSSFPIPMDAVVLERRSSELRRGGMVFEGRKQQTEMGGRVESSAVVTYEEWEKVDRVEESVGMTESMAEQILSKGPGTCMVVWLPAAMQ